MQCSKSPGGLWDGGAFHALKDLEVPLPGDQECLRGLLGRAFPCREAEKDSE